MVGAGVIAAVANALDGAPFPFVFGGDGASFAVSPSDAAAAAKALAQRWRPSRARSFSFDLRVAMTPVGEIRAAGRDVRVARFAAAAALHLCDVRRRRPDWFEQRRSAAHYALPPADRARVPIFPASPAAGASRRRSTDSCCR